jgi:hypothetical protein
LKVESFFVKKGKSDMSVKKILSVLFLLFLFASACRSEVTPQPTNDPGQAETQVAEQVAVQLTEIALSQPSATPVLEMPSSTPTLEQPTELPTSTATPIAVESTATPVPASPTPLPPTNTVPPATLTPKPTATAEPYVCQKVGQTPKDGKTFKPGDNFDAVWTVKNVGSALWGNTDVDYRYKSGDKIHQFEIYDLPESVKPGESIDLTVDMEAPDKEGTYKTTWALQRGSNVICTMTIEINVDK